MHTTYRPAPPRFLTWTFYICFTSLGAFVSYLLTSMFMQMDIDRLSASNRQLNDKLIEVSSDLAGRDQLISLHKTSISNLTAQLTELRKKSEEMKRLVEQMQGTRGGIKIASNPPGATINLGGEATASSPATFTGILASKYSLEVVLDGYDPVTLEAQVVSNKITDLGVVNLTRSNGSININTNPGGAAFILESPGVPAKQGRTPASIPNIPAGPYTITLQQKGYPDVKQHIKIPRNETLEYNWEYGTGTLEIAANPPGATISVDGNVVGPAPQTLKLPCGSHEVSVSYVNLLAKRETVTVETNKTAAVSYNLPLAFLSIVSNPSGVDIWIGNSYCGQTPIDVGLPAGKYEVWAFHPKYAAEKLLVELDNADIRQVPFNLKRPPVSIPRDAEVPMDQFVKTLTNTGAGELLAENGQYLLAYLAFHRASQLFRSILDRFPNFEKAIVIGQIRTVEGYMDQLKAGKKTMPQATGR
ncbi:MAG: PEGA domain-containing protein [Candidatus Methylacidiphilales bacterium]|nr:PEGA domain-containing protein [Candidatus Methylacidiphilales bacterium]